MKLTRFLLLALALVLTACQGQPVEPTPLEVASATPEGVTPPTTTVGPTLAAPTEGAATAVSQGDTPSCTVNSPAPTPGPTERSIFPPVTEADWVIGPETAAVTVIEYSDFQ